MSMFVKERAYKPLNLNQYSKENNPDFLPYKFDHFNLIGRCYIKRMLIRFHNDEYKLPFSLLPLKDFIHAATCWQENVIGIKHPFVYLTVRHGEVTSETDDEWHVDGFSTRITHLPEQNYIWSNHSPTEFVNKKFKIPKDFDPLKHNIQTFFQNRIKEKDKLTMLSKRVYCIDPYVIHRRPFIEPNIHRTFVRLTFSPILIADDTNTQNYLLPVPKFSVDGVKDFRNKLKDYDIFT